MTYDYRTYEDIKVTLAKQSLPEEMLDDIVDDLDGLTDPERLALLQTAFEYGSVSLAEAVLETWGYFEDGERTDKPFHSDDYRGFVEQNVEQEIVHRIGAGVKNGRIEVLEFCNKYPEVFECSDVHQSLTVEALVRSLFRGEPDLHTIHRFAEKLDGFEYSDFINFPRYIVSASPEVAREFWENFELTDEQREQVVDALAWEGSAEATRGILEAISLTEAEQDELLDRLLKGREVLYMKTLQAVLDQVGYSDPRLEEAIVTVLEQSPGYEHSEQITAAIRIFAEQGEHFNSGKIARALDENSGGRSDVDIVEVVEVLIDNVNLGSQLVHGLVALLTDNSRSVRFTEPAMQLVYKALELGLDLSDCEEQILVWACSIADTNKKGRLSFLRMLLEAGFGPNTEDDRHLVRVLNNVVSRPLQRERLKMLVEYGAELNHPDVQEKFFNALNSDRPGGDQFREWAQEQGFELTAGA